MTEIPDILIWAVVIAVIIQGFSMGLLVYLMYQRRRDEKNRLELASRKHPAKDDE